MQTNVYFLSILVQFLVEWEKFQINFVEKIKTHILRSVIFFRKLCLLWDNVEKYCAAGQATDEIWCMRITCWIPKATSTHSRYVIIIAFPLNNVCTNALTCHVLLALPDLFWYWMLSSTLLDKCLYDTFVTVQFLQEMLSWIPGRISVAPVSNRAIIYTDVRMFSSNSFHCRQWDKSQKTRAYVGKIGWNLC